MTNIPTVLLLIVLLFNCSTSLKISQFSKALSNPFIKRLENQNNQKNKNSNYKAKNVFYQT